MEVILLEAIHGLGERGSRVQVAPGYARNFLFPRRLAVVASRAGESIFKEEFRVRSRRDDKNRGAAEQAKAALEGVALQIEAQAADEGKLYGSVGASEIAAALEAKGHTVDRKQIFLVEPIKQVGEHTVAVRLGAGVEAEIQVAVLATE